MEYVCQCGKDTRIKFIRQDGHHGYQACLHLYQVINAVLSTTGYYIISIIIILLLLISIIIIFIYYC